MIEEEGVGGVSRMRPTSSHRLSLPVTVRHSLVVTSAVYVTIAIVHASAHIEKASSYDVRAGGARGSGNKDM